MDSNPVPHVAILPSHGIGHFTPLLELGRRLVTLHGLRVTIFVITTDSRLVRSESIPDGLRIVEIPPVDVIDSVPPDSFVVTRISIVVRGSLPALRSALCEARPRPTVLVVDLFGTDALELAGDLRMSKYVLFTSAAAALALMIYSPTLDRVVPGEYVELPEPVIVPSCKPIRANDLPDPMLDRKNDDYGWYLHHARGFSTADGILVNTCECMEPEPLAALRTDPTLVRIPTPRVYPVGPVIKSSADRPSISKHDCLAWLDSQPPDSVLFVSFGSGGTLSAEQTAELAWGLELSRQRFLWVVRRPTQGNRAATFFISRRGDTHNPSEYLPAGFLRRTEGRGLVVPSWAPQIQILSHPSIGGFLTHGGWNSVLESIIHSVPMITWPLYAEQGMNASMLSEDLKVAVRVTPEGGVVRREETERAARLLIESVEGKAMKSKVKELGDTVSRALGEGGSSYNSLSEVIGEWKMALLAHQI